MKFELSPQQKFSRRALLRALAALPLGLAAFGLPGCAALMQGGGGMQPGDTPGLGALARGKGRVYGAAVQSGQFEDADFAAALRREVGMLAPESELKWNALRPNSHSFDFSGYRRLAAFAHANDMAMRGHVLVWHRANPDWLAPALTKHGQARKILEAHITRVVGETAPLIRNWDVVNEVVYPQAGRENGLRPSLWLKALGPDYIPMAFRIAHRADPGLTLVYNDYGLEDGDGDGNRKRQCTLRLLEQYARDKVPVHALGLQSHLGAHRPLAGNAFTDFLKEARTLGLKIYITELDLDISRLSGRTDDKIRIAQNYVRTYLDMVQKDGPVDMLVTWGLSDRHTWLSAAHPDVEGALPLDRDLHRGPLWSTLRDGWAVRG